MHTVQIFCLHMSLIMPSRPPLCIMHTVPFLCFHMSIITPTRPAFTHEDHMPLLGADPAGFLYTAVDGSGALNAGKKISFNGCWSFVLCHKAARQDVTGEAAGSEAEPESAHLRPRDFGFLGIGFWIFLCFPNMILYAVCIWSKKML
ncbi:hypothetical protein BS78_03G237800 [Paspalum vaginatum]|nr:hypothetical protein BS78_03G237800 [Paspalum vaginatum]